MTVRELIALLEKFARPDAKINIEVGGDGAIHTDVPNRITIDLEGNVTISAQ